MQQYSPYSIYQLVIAQAIVYTLPIKKLWGKKGKKNIQVLSSATGSNLREIIEDVRYPGIFLVSPQ